MPDYESISQAVRRRLIKAIYTARKGHLGGALSSTDILVWLYANKMVTPARPGERSARPLVLSKGHSATALLAVLDELEDKDQLSSYNLEGGLVGNNPSEQVYGIEFHTGSLGHGVGLAAGVAFAKRLSVDTEPVIVLISDGEYNEGSIWEAIQFVASHSLNVCILVDSNGQICEDFIEDASFVKDPEKAFTGFGFKTMEINGHCFADLQRLDTFINDSNEPRICFLKTIKGKGVSFMEGQTRWHHSIPTETEYEAAMKELGL